MSNRFAIAVRAGILVAGLPLAAPSTLAKDVVFNPSLGISQGFTNNLTFQGQGDDRVTDRVGVFEFEFPVERETRRSYLNFLYRPTFLRYADVSELDYTDQRLDLNWRSKLSRRSRLDLRATYISTQAQGAPEQPDDPNLNLTPRADRDLYRLTFRFRHDAGERWFWNLKLDGRAFVYKPIPPLSEEGDFEDRTDYGPLFGGARRLSETVSVGGRYEYRRFDLDAAGDEDSHQLAATYTQRIARRLDLEAALGGFSNTASVEGVDRTGVLAELFVTRTYKSFSIRLDLWHRPTAGGALNGTAIESNLGFNFRSTPDRRRHWIWRVSPRVASREPSGEGKTINSASLIARVEWRWADRLGIRLRTDWYKQSTDDSVIRGDLGVVWYPLGATQLGGQGR